MYVSAVCNISEQLVSQCVTLTVLRHKHHHLYLIFIFHGENVPCFPSDVLWLHCINSL